MAGIYAEAAMQPEDIIYFGSDDEDYDSPETRRQRCEAAGRRILEGRSLNLLSASLAGPFEKESGWTNPWRSKYRTQKRNVANSLPTAPSSQHVQTPTKRAHATHKQTEEPFKCHLPSPESLKQVSPASAHPFLEKDDLQKVRNWRSTVELQPMNEDGDQPDAPTGSDKRKASNSDWLKTRRSKRAKSEESPPEMLPSPSQEDDRSHRKRARKTYRQNGADVNISFESAPAILGRPEDQNELEGEDELVEASTPSFQKAVPRKSPPKRKSPRQRRSPRHSTRGRSSKEGESDDELLVLQTSQASRLATEATSKKTPILVKKEEPDETVDTTREVASLDTAVSSSDEPTPTKAETVATAEAPPSTPKTSLAQSKGSAAKRKRSDSGNSSVETPVSAEKGTNKAYPCSVESSLQKTPSNADAAKGSDSLKRDNSNSLESFTPNTTRISQSDANETNNEAADKSKNEAAADEQGVSSAEQNDNDSFQYRRRSTMGAPPNLANSFETPAHEDAQLHNSDTPANPAAADDEMCGLDEMDVDKNGEPQESPEVKIADASSAQTDEADAQMAIDAQLRSEDDHTEHETSMNSKTPILQDNAVALPESSAEEASLASKAGPETNPASEASMWDFDEDDSSLKLTPVSIRKSTTAQPKNGVPPSTLDKDGFRPPARPARATTPEPTFSLKSFASFMSPSPMKRTSTNKGKGSRRVSWAPLPHETEEKDENSYKILAKKPAHHGRQTSPPPEVASNELPTDEQDQFHDHFSAVAKRKGILKGQPIRSRPFASAFNSIAPCRDLNPASKPVSQDASVESSQHDQENRPREISQPDEPTQMGSQDLVDEVFEEMSGFLQAFDVEGELDEARKAQPCPSNCG